MIELEFGSSLAADVAAVWSVVSTMDGVNSELHPFVHMSGVGHETLPTDITPGEVLFKSWLLLFCVLPFDRHALALVRIEEDHGFVEESTSWLQRRWHHERRITANDAQGCDITDRLLIEPRVRFARPVVAFAATLLFRHRHRRLRRRFDGTTTTNS